MFFWTIAYPRTTRSWYRVMNYFGKSSVGSILLFLGPYLYNMAMYFLFRPGPLCPTMQSITYSERDVEKFLTFTVVFFFCSFIFVEVYSSSVLDVCTATRCFASSRAAVTQRINPVFATSFSRITTVSGCTLEF